jgi:hypothetical protein
VVIVNDSSGASEKDKDYFVKGGAIFWIGLLAILLYMYLQKA